VSWTGTVHNRDYVTIVPMGADEGATGDYFRVGGSDSTNSLKAPAETGLYEVRYVLNEGKRVMANETIEITEPEITVNASSKVRASDTIRVEWTGTVHPRDYVTIVPMGADNDVSGDYFRVGDKNQHDIQAPETKGLYEMRYVLNEGKRVMATTKVEVLAADAPLEKGASLSAPETAATGEMITVGWTVDSESADQRLTVARADQAIFTWVSAVKLEGNSPLEIALPDEPGNYELRLLDVAEKKILARRTIQVD
jgi:Ca-activated chloride channel family protein